MSTGKSVIVCGGGIVGLCCAYYLARDGAKVTVIERNGPDRDHCALGSAGYISPSHVVPLASPGMVKLGLKWMFDSTGPFYVKPRVDPAFLRWSFLFWRACNPKHVERGAPLLRDLCVTSRELVGEMDAATGGTSFDYEKLGLFNVCRTKAALHHEEDHLGRVANSIGVEARTLDADQVAQMNPGVRMNIAGAVYFPIDAHMSPHKFAKAVDKLALDAKVDVRWNTTITGWRRKNGRITAVQTSAGELEADEFVLAGGSWSPSMLDGLGIDLPMQAGKGYSLTMEKPPVRLKIPVILTERRIAVTPMGNSMRFGGTMELSGINGIVRDERVQQIIRSVPEYLPDYQPEHFKGIKPWIGLRPVSPDGLPYIGRFASATNLVAACGHAMLGLTLAPITGKLVAEVIGNRKPSIDLSLLKPDRYS